MDEKYTNSFIDSSHVFINKLFYLGANDLITLKALDLLKMILQIYNWAEWFEVSEKNKRKLEQIMDCIILRNSNLILPTIVPDCLHYSNVSTPQTMYTWQEICSNEEAFTYYSI